ncbi:hypothetical protein PHMEG_00029185 [Phytophthora megakarya]|uniref:Uncharacterized protein n=1 Tax=Phytophthora megakarya TaxID=4795 RepID=A0A225V2N6_9STRA|nr:hypothetical protein PHMEG_00029185 [Phytophthora megakarya]
MARQPPARVNSFLDQRLDGASTAQEVLTAAVAPHRLPPQEADELIRLRDEVSRLQTRCEDAERGLANEVQLRTAAEADSLVARILELDITVAEQAHGVQRLKDRCRSSDADCAAVMRYVAQERERMKAGLAVYNAELAKLRQYLEEHDRGKVCSPSPRMKALLAENASLHRVNSVLRQNSAEHGLNTDALVLSTAGLSASGLGWELLGLGPDHTGLLRLLPPSSQPEDSVGEDSAPPVIEPATPPAQATEVSVRSSSRTRRGRSHVVQSDPRPRRPTRGITATVTARRGTDTTTFTPAVAVISRATNSQKLPANAERFLKPGFTAVGAQKA